MSRYDVAVLQGDFFVIKPQQELHPVKPDTRIRHNYTPTKKNVNRIKKKHLQNFAESDSMYRHDKIRQKIRRFKRRIFLLFECYFHFQLSNALQDAQQSQGQQIKTAPGAFSWLLGRFCLWAHILGECSQRFQMDEQKLPKTGLTVGPNLYGNNGVVVAP